MDVSYTVGRHAFKFGFSYNRYTKNQMLYGDEQGDYGTNSLSNDGIIDYLLGIPSSYSQAQGAPIRHYVNQTPSVYAMDNWHVTPRLSLQLGLRYDALPHAWERNNYVGNFDAASYISSQAPVWSGTSGAISSTSPDLYTFNGIPSYINGIGLSGVNNFPRGAVENDYKTLQPRVGFSQDVFGNGKTVIRGGIGTFYERLQGNDIFGVATNAPFNPGLGLSNPYFSNPGKAWDTGNVIGPSQLIFAGSVNNMAHSYRAPATAQYSLGVQHELAPSLIWVVQYVGNLEWHQSIQRHINNFDPNNPAVEASYASTNSLKAATTAPFRCITGDSGGNYNSGNYAGAPSAVQESSCTNTNAATIQPNGGANSFRPYQGYTDINQDENTTNGSYNAFQTGIRVQNRWGLSGELDYTWSHELDITSADITDVDNPWNLKYDKGAGLYDRRQMLSANYIYKLPFLNKGASLLESIAGGWELAGTIIDETGVPTPVTDSLNYDPVGLNGNYTVRPNIVGKMHYNKKMGSWFNTGQFSAPVPFWLGGANQGFGNGSKDAVVGPGRVNFTTSLYKSFSITERAHFELRFESFNTFNHTEPYGLQTGSTGQGFDPQNGAFSTVLGSGNTFGQVHDTWDPRALEIGGKFVF